MTRAYQTGMACMDTWIKRCLPTDGQRHVQQQTGGARALMRFLCTNDTALRRGENRLTVTTTLAHEAYFICSIT